MPIATLLVDARDKASRYADFWSGPRVLFCGIYQEIQIQLK